ncbi:MAG TPA: hypothetical protein VN673_03565, partial [Clostridia bacterium]|nr:hypothetical protein [Clostridia bacterium]
MSCLYRTSAIGRCLASFLLALTLLQVQAATPVIRMQSAVNGGFDVYADDVLVAPIRLAANGAIVASQVAATADSIRLSGLRAKDGAAVTFASDDYVSISLPAPGSAFPEPVVSFKLTIRSFDTNKWLALFPGGPAPFHFLICSLPQAQVWHQRGWLNATP